MPQQTPYPAKKRKAWENLCAILKSFQGPWVCLGDFNYIVNAEEKYGGVKGGTSAPNYLKELMFDLGAIDLGHLGNKFTWAKGRWGSSTIKEILDSPYPFRFEAAWIRDERCQGVIEQAWNIEVWGSQLSRLCKKQDATREVLCKWNKEIFGNIHTRISSLMQKLKEIQGNPSSEENNRLETEVETPQQLDDLVSPCISDVENQLLCSIPSLEDIKNTLFQMSDLKAPGPDGFRVLFYKEYWPIVGETVINAVTSFFEVGRLPSESAFIHNRWIAENQVIVQEMLHSFKARKMKEGLMAIKLDFQKAYDRVNWSFIKVVLIKFGFINWIMECITSVSFEVLIKGGKSKNFRSERRLRQGDPLFLYIFILGREAATTNQCLETYCSWSGQSLNRSKSSVFFSKNCQKQKCREIKQILQMKGLKKDSIYFGAPLFLSKAPSKDFKFLQDRLEARLMGWRSKCLSWAGRSTLIKFVARAIPTYSMSTFNIPNKICDKLDAATRRFRWRPKKSEGRFVAWRAWDKLCQPKCQGGLRFKKAKDVNQILLAKLTWMIDSKRDSLCMRILRAKYKVRNDWLRKNPPKRASSVWKAIEGAKKLIAKRACYLIGDVQAVIQIQIPLSPRLDKLIWVLDQKGDFSVKSAYQASRDQSPRNAPYNVPWQKLWMLNAPKRTKVLLWRIGQNSLPTKENIVLRIGEGNPNCVLCGENIEYCCHLFIKCNVARALWFASCGGLRSDAISISTNEDIVKFIVSPNSFLGPVSTRNKEDNELDSLRMLITLEAIWFMRNQLLHNVGHIDFIEASQLIKKRTLEYAKTLSKEKTVSKDKSISGWEAPEEGWIKLNMDAVVFDNATALAMVARNKNGEVLKVWAKKHEWCSPMQAEAAAVYWAIQLAQSEKWQHIIIEGDAKSCFDPLTTSKLQPDWSIATIISNILDLRKLFLNCNFSWVRRCCNTVAYEAAKSL
ncbi:hypothetical protein SO802_029642 [Lithocarpus litseifolius]|uniref:Reverse transcriptase domain-containing protein n=1 Tax=Lithocarpus litseifolius TaxID=425828 RepID=A0AAW2BVS9_9ROSI